MRDLRPLLDPRSVAVIGATPTEGRIGFVALDHLVKLGFEGDVFPVNPKYPEIGGRTCYADVESLPRTPDVAVISLAAAEVLPALRRCHAKGIPAAVVYASGFAEEGAEGAELQRELQAFAADSHMVIAGPNGMGNANLKTGAITSFATLFREHTPQLSFGQNALLTQSGNLCAMLFSAGRARGLQFSHFINTGNEACVEFSEYLDYLADDADTATVLGYIEGLRDGPAFARACLKMRHAGKPLILLKGGRSEQGAQAAATHTAAMAGSHVMYQVAFRALGVIEAQHPTHALDIAYLCQFRSRRAGPRVAIASISGAMGAMLTDMMSDLKIQLPQLTQETQARLKRAGPSMPMVANPIDMTGHIANKEGMAAELLAALRDDASIDVVVVYCMGSWLDRMTDDLVHEAAQSPRLTVVIDTGEATRRAELEAAGIPVFTDVARASEALATYLRWAETDGHSTEAMEALDLLKQAAPPPPINDKTRTLDEVAAKELLEQGGLQTCDRGLATSEDGAVSIAQTLGYPLAMKIVSADILHKTEAGGVRLNVRGEDEVRAAYQSITEQVSASRPEAVCRGVLIEKMASGIAELIVGVTQDAVFGKVMTVGYGGVAVEIFKDVTHRLLPVDAATARTMLSELRSFPLLNGFRGKPAANLDAAARAIAALSDLAVQSGHPLRELEVNPLLLTGQGAYALDALVLLNTDEESTL